MSSAIALVRCAFIQRKICLKLHFDSVLRIRPFSVNVKDKYVVTPQHVIDIPTNIPLHKYLLDALEKHSGRTLMVNGEDGSSYTCSDAKNQVLRLSSALAKLGISKGEMVAIVSPNCVEFPIGVLAAMNLGAIVTPLSPYFTSDEISRQLNDSESSIVICHEDSLKEVRKALTTVPTVRHLIVIGGDHGGENALSFQKMIEKDDGTGIQSTVQINPSEDVAILPYSSGTTGLPKGVMLTHENLVANLLQTFHPSVLPYKGDNQEVFIAILPLYHIYGLFINVFLSWILGAKNIFMKKYDFKTYVHLIEKYKATSLQTVPPIVTSLCNEEIATPERLASVEIIGCAAAPVGQALHTRFVKKFGSSIQFLEGFGMTELSPVCATTRRGDFVSGSCGPVVPNTYVKIANSETGESLPFGAEGELWVKGPQVMKGYWKNREATKNTITEEGWLRTGDIAKVDVEGNIYMLDRIKELIKVKGLQVAPAELEDILRKHPSVQDIAVIGIPDDKSGEVPKAFVVPSKGHAPTEEELKAFVEDKVAPYKRLKGGVVMVEQIPKSPSGKILRRVLRGEYA